MRDIRRSRHCRRLFFRYLRQRDKEKEAEKHLSTPTENSKPNPQFDKFNTAISTAIAATIFIGFIFIFVYYYIAIACFVALVFEFLIMVIGAIHFGNKERKQEENEGKPTTTASAVQNQPATNTDTTPQLNIPVVPEKENLANLISAETEPPAILEPFDMLTGVQFKDLVEKYFYRKGYTIQRIAPRINNIDFIVQKGETVTAVATKMTFDLIYRSYVKKVVESAKYYNAKNITIITTSYFVAEAHQLAKECGITVWDRDKLKSKLGGLK